MGKVIIFSAPSGAGKTTIVHSLLKNNKFNLEFSVSACSRKKRGKEEDGKDYYFISADNFRDMIKKEAFIEWEEVYKDHYYGSLKSEVERIINSGNNVVFDVDVKGGMKIKDYYKDKALSLFIMPPSVEELERRLKNRSTDNPEAIRTRIKKAKFEIGFANKFDKIIINDDLEKAKIETHSIIKNFLEEV